MVSILMETLVVKGLILNEFKAYGFLMISRGVKVNQTAPNCLILNAKFGNVFLPAVEKPMLNLYEMLIEVSETISHVHLIPRVSGEHLIEFTDRHQILLLILTLCAPIPDEERKLA